MDFGICTLAVIPVRVQPADTSEMSTQILFGDLVEVLEKQGSWLKIRNLFDGYEGWVDFKQVTPLEKSEFEALNTAKYDVNHRNYLDYVNLKGEKIHLPAGCSLYLDEHSSFTLAGENGTFNGDRFPFIFSGVDRLLATAMDYLGNPYLWGGKTCFGLDCSGFTQVVYKQHGVKLLRDAAQQAGQGELINLLSDSVPGDLAFFDHDDERISHVGILIDQSSIIHCSGKVRIDAIDHQGIYNRDLKKYTHSLRLIRRVL